MENNLFVVASPFQMVSAFEAVISMGLKDSNNIIIIYNSGHNFNDLFIRNVIDLYSPIVKCQLFFLKRTSLWSFLEKLYSVRKFKSIIFENLFLGHIEEYSNKLFICNTKCKNVYSLDDGAATLVMNDLHLARISQIRCNDGSIVKRLLKKGVSFAFGLKDKADVKINWFTMFSFTPNNKNKYVQHSFQGLNQIINRNENRKLTKEVYFIGSNLVNAGVVNGIDVYLEMLNEVFENFREKEIVYVPHRYEDVSLLTPLVEKYSLKILKPSNIIEVFFVEQNLLPLEIVSFYSTALVSLSKIYPSSVVKFKKIPTEKVVDQFHNSVQTVQNYYSQSFDSI